MKFPRVSDVLCRHDNTVVAIAHRPAMFADLGVKSAPLPPRPVSPFVAASLTLPLIKRTLVKAPVEPVSKAPEEDDGSSVWTYVTESSEEAQQREPVREVEPPKNDIGMSVYDQFGLVHFY